MTNLMDDSCASHRTHIRPVHIPTNNLLPEHVENCVHVVQFVTLPIVSKGDVRAASTHTFYQPLTAQEEQATPDQSD